MRPAILEIFRYVVAHQHNLVAAWATFFLARTLTFIAAQARPVGSWSLAAAVDAIFPRTLWASRSGLFDMFMFLLERVTGPMMAIGEIAAMTFVARLISTMFGSLHIQPVGELTGLALATCAVLGFVITDLASYLAHYLMHHVPALWEIHKLHHSASVLSPFTSSRSHPIERKLNGLVGCLLSGVFFGLVGVFFNATIGQLLMVIATARFIFDLLLLNSIRHSDLKISFGLLEWVFVSPRVHQLHHSADPRHWNRNMGIVLSLWDHIFGTFHKVEKGEGFTFGIGEGPENDASHNGIYGGLIQPVVRMVRVLVVTTPRQSGKPTPSTTSVSELGPAHGNLAD